MRPRGTEENVALVVFSGRQGKASFLLGEVCVRVSFHRVCSCLLERRREKPQESCARQLEEEEGRRCERSGANNWYSEPCRSEAVATRRTPCEMEAGGARRRSVAALTARGRYEEEITRGDRRREGVVRVKRMPLHTA